MKSLLRWTGRCVLGGAAVLFANYHLAAPPVDLSTAKEKSLGFSPSPLRFPSDLSTRVLLKLLNSVFYTTHSLGVATPRFLGKDIECLLEELKVYVTPEVFENAKKSLKLLDESVNMEIGCTPMEVIAIKGMFMRMIRSWIDCEKEFVKEKDVIANEKLKPQIIITGQPRTGSTFLHHILSQDPSCRFLTQWEQESPIPFPTANTYLTDPRREGPRKTAWFVDRFMVKNWLKYRNVMHDVDGTGVEEELFVLVMTMNVPLSNCWRSPFSQWVLSSPKEYTYHFLHKFLFMSQHYHPPSSHWILKSPVHGWYFPTLLKEFPSATIVVTHRDPLLTVPSVAKLLATVNTVLFHDVQKSALTPYIFKEHFGKDMCDFVKRMVVTIDTFRETASERDQKRILDVEYDDFVKDPMGVVKVIYNKAGLTLTEEAERRMRAYIDENQRDRKKGKGSVFYPYTLEEFGLDEEYVKREMAAYRNKHGYKK